MRCTTVSCRLSGAILLANMMVDEVIVGAPGSGLWGMLLFALVTVFVAGLMIGRTPEYIGKKIEAREIKMAMLALLVAPALILGLTALASVVPAGLAGPGNSGPHGFSEILYAYTSAAATNGSAFAGLSANTPFYNLTLALAMFAGRFFVIVPVLAIAGSLAAKRSDAALRRHPADGRPSIRSAACRDDLDRRRSQLLSGTVARSAGRAFRYAGAGHLLTNGQAALSADLGCQRDLVSTTRSAAADPRSW